MVVCKVTRRFQVTIPKAVREELKLEEGTHLAVGVENGSIVLTPQEIDPDQAWFWTEEWQEGEREADEDIRQGRVSGPFETADELIGHLRDEGSHD